MPQPVFAIGGQRIFFISDGSSSSRLDSIDPPMLWRRFLASSSDRTLADLHVRSAVGFDWTDFRLIPTVENHPVTAQSARLATIREKSLIFGFTANALRMITISARLLPREYPAWQDGSCCIARRRKVIVGFGDMRKQHVGGNLFFPLRCALIMSHRFIRKHEEWLSIKNWGHGVNERPPCPLCVISD